MTPSAVHRALLPALVSLLCGVSLAHTANIAPEGSALIGVNDSVDFTDLGTPLVHAGVAGATNDKNADSRVDTFGNGSQVYSYVGVEWTVARPDPVRTLVLTMATFFDGGWFGANGLGPGAGGSLSPAHLTAPSVQISTDFSATWTTIGSTSNYLRAFTGHRIGDSAGANPTSRAAVFTPDIPQTGITGIRLIGPNGGSADGNGFIGVSEHDGGWFGPNGVGPGAGGFLNTAAHLIEPTLQITYDESLSWVPASVSSDYLSTLDGPPVPAVAGGTPTSVSVTFAFDPPLVIAATSVHGVRLTGLEGGTASGGFLGVVELAFDSSLSSSDTDGDGQGDVSEILGGTNPTDANSNLRITGIQRAGDQLLLTWSSVLGKTYRIEASETLLNWSLRQGDLPAAAAPATVSQASIPLGGTPLPPLPASLYARVRVQSR